jgi:hypothetical protein
MQDFIHILNTLNYPGAIAIVGIAAAVAYISRS